MTDKEKVLAKWPEAHSWIVFCTPWLYFVQPCEGYAQKEIGEGATEDMAWADAAKSAGESE